MAEKAVSRSTLSRQVYQYLRRGIILQETPQLYMGQKLNEVELARMLGCSTTPVREAINMLRQEKLIVSTAFHCSSVVSFQEEDIKNLMYVRKSLELAGLRQAFERITEEDVKELERIVENYRQAYERIDVEMVSYHNKIFHNLILQRSQNSILLEMIESISDRSDMIRAPMVHHQKRVNTGLRAVAVGEHEALLEAIRRRDLAAAERCLGAHIDRMCRDVLKFYEEHQADLMGA